jgi:asparagine synthase (glutamine-hydrolysing)
MCGIAGELRWGGPPDASAVQRMTARLAHRGPDAQGAIARGPVALGHRRLAVIDLDPGSSQPMADASGGLWIVFNGEIYNFRELRERLERKGGIFRTRGDTEVLLEAYRAWGDRFLAELDGMFAFALWDEARRRLLLARDRAGEKPLYWQPLAGDEGGLLFASELGALSAHPEASRTVDAAAVGDFLSLGYTLGERPILAGVRRLPPACLLVAERGRPLEARLYWDLAAHFRSKPPIRSVDEAVDELDARLEASVRRRLISDVPLGAFLSGGLDSSTIVAAMKRSRPEPRPRAFTIGFDEASFDELPEARAVAGRLGIELSGRYVGADAAEALRHLVEVQGEPFADTSIVPFYYLARDARRHVTVCLSGDGGDELFAGYPTYAADRLHHLTRWAPAWAARGAGYLLGRIRSSSFRKVSIGYKARQFLSGHGLDFRRAHHHWRTLFSPEAKQTLLRPRWRDEAASDGFDLFSRHFDRVAGCDELDQALYVDIKTWLVDDILFKVDRATMIHSLEARAPFLESRLMEFAAGLPPEWKLRGFEGKWLLRRAARRHLPARTVRRSKRGFNAPVSRWLAGPLAQFGRAAMADSELFDWVEPAAVEALWSDHDARRADHGFRLFTLICLALWMRRSR